MGCQSVSEFPIELQTIILTYLCNAYQLEQGSQEVALNSRRKVYDPDYSIPEDVRSPSLFPYNVVSVCKVWRDIMVQIPEAWTRLVFDVTQSPTPFLNSFLWSKGQIDLEVVIFNSTDGAGIEDKARERKHVMAIQQAFLPHISRCKSIIYNLLFSSCLPAPDTFFRRPMLFLRELRLDCQQDDLDPTVPLGRRQPFAVSFPKLEMLSLSGFWFMNTVRHAGAQWISEMQVSRSPTLRISRFRLAAEGVYSFNTFMEYTSRISVKFPNIYLHGMSLTFPHTDLTSNFEEFRFGPSLHFQSVSANFLAGLDLHCIVEVILEDMSFKDCRIPPLHNFSILGSLDINDISDSDNDASIRNTIGCGGTNISCISNCPSFHEGTLRWLATPDMTGMPCTITREKLDPFSQFLPAPGLRSLRIRNCGHVSPHAVTGFLHRRPNCHISIEGPEVPRLTEDVKKLFRRTDALPGSVHWIAGDDIEGCCSWPSQDLNESLNELTD